MTAGNDTQGGRDIETLRHCASMRATPQTSCWLLDVSWRVAFLKTTSRLQDEVPISDRV